MALSLTYIKMRALTLLAASISSLSLVDAARARQIDTHRPNLDAVPPHGAAAIRRAIRSWSPVHVSATATTLLPVSFGADPTGHTDSSPAFAALVTALLALNTSSHTLSSGITDLGGAVVDLAGGDYLLSSTLTFPKLYGNFRIVDGTLRAAPQFQGSTLVQVGETGCAADSQGVCNENVGMSGLTLDAQHNVGTCLRVSNTMGSTLDSSSMIFGFDVVGVDVESGHGMMISETWVASRFWSDPKKAHTQSIGIALQGNDQYVTNTIVFSAKVGVAVMGGANVLQGVHTWNEATANGGIGILVTKGRNRVIGCYLDFTDLVLTDDGTLQTLVTDGFFLGGAQILLNASSPQATVFGLTVVGNTWYDQRGEVPIAVQEGGGNAWRSVTDFTWVGNVVERGSPPGTFPRAELVVKATAGAQQVDFSSALLFPSVAIASARVTVLSDSVWDHASVVGGASGWVQTVYNGGGGVQLRVEVDQSGYTAGGGVGGGRR